MEKKPIKEESEFPQEATCASKSPILKPQKPIEKAMDSTTVAIRVGKEKYSWSMPAPVTGKAMYERLEAELGLKKDDVRSITMGGKKVKPDTMITEKLIVNLTKKKPQIVSTPPAETSNVTYNFDFSSFWPSLSSLYSYFSSGDSVKELPTGSEQAKCEHALRSTASLLKEASQILDKDASAISKDPTKFQESLNKIDELGQAISKLGFGLAHQKTSSSVNPPPAFEKKKSSEEMTDDLIDDLLAEAEPVQELNIEQTVVATKPSKAAAPQNNMMDIMNSLMKPPSGDSNGAPANNLLNMLMKNNQNSGPPPGPSSPTAWKKSLSGKKAAQYAKIFQRDTRVMRSCKLELSSSYLLGSSNVNSKKLQAMMQK